jgi:hypothetical protein
MIGSLVMRRRFGNREEPGNLSALYSNSNDDYTSGPARSRIRIAHTNTVSLRSNLQRRED